MSTSTENFAQPVGYYIEPLVWVGEAPAGVDAPGQLEEVDFAAFDDVVVRHNLMGGRLPVASSETAWWSSTSA